MVRLNTAKNKIYISLIKSLYIFKRYGDLL